MLSKLFYGFNIVKTGLEIYARLTAVLAVDTDIICRLLQYICGFPAKRVILHWKKRGRQKDKDERVFYSIYSFIDIVYKVHFKCLLFAQAFTGYDKTSLIHLFRKTFMLSKPF